MPSIFEPEAERSSRLTRPITMEARHLLADRRARWAAIVAATLLLLLLLLAMFPWGMLRGTIQARLEKKIGRPVAIGSIDRLDTFSFTPTVAIRDVRIPQPRWVGPGDLAQVRTLKVRFRVFPLLIGRFSPLAIDVNGMRLALVRAADRRENWHDDKGDAPKLNLEGLRVSNTRIQYRDAVQQRAFDLDFTSDDQNGIRIAGTGTIRGNPVRLVASGPPVSAGTGKLWPFRLAIDGPAVAMHVAGAMERPLDSSRMTFDMTTRADDLKLVDAIIEAGLFGTQPVSLKAHVRHDDMDWAVTGLTGQIGSSDIAGEVTVKKRDGRTLLDGAVHSRLLNFEDLASDKGLAKARALQAEIGKRLVPNTKVNLKHLAKTDGRIAVTIDHITSRSGKSSLVGLTGTLDLDHQLLTVDPLVITLTQGTIRGPVTVDQRNGRKVPLVLLNLRLAGATIDELAGGEGKVQGQVIARAHLSGPGSTIREAVGHSTGSIALVARDGTLPAKFASMMGFDAGRALTTGDDRRAGLRCVIARFRLRDGTGTTDPFLIDTSRSRMDGTGTLSFPAEALNIRLTGAPKKDSLIRLPGSATLTGTIREPDVQVAPGTKSIGNVFKALGRAITGHQGPTATDADCAALESRVLAE